MHGYNLKEIVLFIIIVLFGVQKNTCQKLHSTRHLKSQFKQFMKDTLLRGASVSCHIYDIRKAKTIIEYDPDRALIPSSTQKLITAALLLDTLKDNQAFETRFILDGQPGDSGVFEGNLRVLGGGDPAFCSPFISGAVSFEALADTLTLLLKAKGITAISGGVVVDPSFIQDIPENAEWLWYDLGNYYGAGCYGLNFMENEIQVILEPGKEPLHTCPIRDVKPFLYKDYFYSKVVGKDSFTKDAVFVLGSSQAEKRPLYGQWKCCSDDSLQIRASMPNPPACFSTMLKIALSERGIPCSNPSFEIPFGEYPIYIYRSPVMEDLVRRNLKKSINLYSESFLHLLGYNWNHSTQRDSILKNLTEYIRGEITHSASFIMVDGSGLSRKNQMSAKDMTEFLSWLCNRPKLNSFWKLIPDAYSNVSLEPYLIPKVDLNYSLRLKSGSMERIRAYAGFLVIDQKPVLAIDFMVNYYTCSSADLTKRIASFLSELVNTQY